MKNFIAVLLATGCGLLVSPCGAQSAGWPNTHERSCSASNFHSDDLVSYAELREQRLANGSTDYISPGQNGSIRVHGWSNGDVLVKACIITAAFTDAEARAMASRVNIVRGPGQIEPTGPSEEQRQHWNISYEVWVPTGSNLDLKAHNGSIATDAVRGQIRFHTQNGSVHLSDVGGDVEGSTINGSVAVDLMGSGWNGRGLKTNTVNGSVRLTLPENCNAQVKASTVNGRVHVDFPVTMTGEIGRHLNFQLGSGGPEIETTTVNGSIHIAHRT